MIIKIVDQDEPLRIPKNQYTDIEIKDNNLLVFDKSRLVGIYKLSIIEALSDFHSDFD